MKTTLYKSIKIWKYSFLAFEDTDRVIKAILCKGC